MKAISNKSGQVGRLFSATALLLWLNISPPWVALAQSQAGANATLTVDARKVVGKIGPLLYGQFLEWAVP